MEQINNSSRWKYPILAFFIMLVLGLIYAWSIFVVPLEQAFGWTRVETSITFTVMLICFATGQFTGATWSKRFGPKNTVTACGIIIFIGFFLTSFTSSLIWLYVCLGAICGYPIGVALNNALNSAIRWFPDRSGLATGIVIMGFGLSNLLLGSIANWVITAFGWQMAFRVLAVAALVLVVILSRFLKLPPENYRPAGWTPPALEAAGDDSMNYTRKEMCSTGKFWFFYLWFFANHLGGFMVLSCIAPYGIACGMAAAMAALLMGLFGVANALGRPIIGLLSDKFGKRTLILFDTILMACGLILMSFLPTVMDPFIGSMIGALCIGFAFGGSISLGVSTVRTYYGAKHVGSNMGVIASVDLPAGICGPMIAAAIYTATGTYANAFYTAAGVLVVALIFSFLMGKPQPKKNA